MKEFKFPEFVVGPFDADSGRWIAEKVEGRCVLEIGSGLGQGTLCMVQSASFLHACGGAPLVDRLCGAGVIDRVKVHTSGGETALEPSLFDAVVVHLADTEKLRRAACLVASGGRILYHKEYQESAKVALKDLAHTACEAHASGWVCLTVKKPKRFTLDAEQLETEIAALAKQRYDAQVLVAKITVMVDTLTQLKEKIDADSE